jgi:CDP-diglyceride synthetase
MEDLEEKQAQAAKSDEPTDESNFMYRKHAPNGWIYGLVVGAMAVVAFVIWGIYRYWDVAASTDATEGDVLRMVILMGALGGAIHWMSSLANYIGNGNLFRRWIPYYLLAPFQGSALAMLVYLLLRVGVLAPPTSGTEDTSPAQTLNLLGLYAFSGLTGLFAKQAIEMLRDVFAVVFKRVEGKDPSQGTKPPSPGAAKPAGGGEAAKG